MAKLSNDIREKGLKQRLTDGEIIIADGAIGTMLIKAGLEPGAPSELWNIQYPQRILDLHRAYINAGSQIILTNTFGGSRSKLNRFGKSEQVNELNREGARLAREAAGEKAYVAGDIGPTGEMMEPYGDLTFEKAVEYFAEQTSALVEGGVDALWIETITDLEETRAAITGVVQVTNLPLLCSLSFGPQGKTMMGVGAEQLVETLCPLGLTALGANCGEGLDAIKIVLEQLKVSVPTMPLIAKANAGLPKIVDGQVVYEISPETFAKQVCTFGAQVIGGCCGSNPEFITAIAKTLGR